MSSVATGTVTFLMTDIEGSTALWERSPAAMSDALALHDGIAEQVIREWNGSLVKERGEGDSLFAVFERAGNAVMAALELQRELSQLEVNGSPLRVRVAVHSGEVELRDGDYYGPSVNRCARLRGAAHGGQVLVSQATRQLAADSIPPHVELEDLGSHRLRDLLRPERVFLARAEGDGAQYPPLKSLNQAPHNLPLQLTSFVGREEELASVRELLGSHRLVTLLGLGGGGKTRLSLQVGAEAVESFPDGVWQVELVNATSADRFHREVADALQCEQGLLWREWLTDKNLLLILDNCEKAAREIGKVVQGLLSEAPGLKVLATSREPLKMRGEQLYRVPPLSLPGEGAEPEEIASSEAVALFMDRARMHNPSFALNEKNAPTIGEITRRLAGIPLALEQAASNITLLTPQQMLGRWQDRFPALSNEEVGSVERHETLRACFEWSYEMLPEAERVLFGRLSAFSGGWTLEAAEDVCAYGKLSVDDVLPALTGLVARSLVVVTDDEQGTRRFHFLEPVRQFAELKVDEADEVGERHFSWALGLARVLGSVVEQSYGVHGLEREHDNIRRALSWAIDNRFGPAAELAVAVRKFWGYAGYAGDGLAWCKKLIDQGSIEPPTVRAHLLNVYGSFLNLSGDVATARDVYMESLGLWLELQEPVQCGIIENNLGVLCSQEDLYDEALGHFNRSLEHHGSVNNEAGKAWASLNLAAVLKKIGDPDGICFGKIQLSKATFEKLGSDFGVAWASCELAAHYVDSDVRASARPSSE